jgi:ABC-type oligopeptide transport system ATPase subunit
MKPRFFIVMGVSGCGKTSVGEALASIWDGIFTTPTLG